MTQSHEAILCPELKRQTRSLKFWCENIYLIRVFGFAYIRLKFQVILISYFDVFIRLCLSMAASGICIRVASTTSPQDHGKTIGFQSSKKIGSVIEIITRFSGKVAGMSLSSGNANSRRTRWRGHYKRFTMQY
jgi:hypothetical protein